MNSSTVAFGPWVLKLLKGSEYAFSCSHEKVVKFDEAVEKKNQSATSVYVLPKVW